MLDPLWRQKLNTFRRVIGENLGVRDFRGIASWGAAFGVAYWLWVRPTWKEQEQIQVQTPPFTSTFKQNIARIDRKRTGTSQSFTATKRELSGMVLGFDNGGLLVAVGFAALVLKPYQLTALGRQCGRIVGWAVGQVSLLRNEISRSQGKSEMAKMHQEMQETMSALNAIRHEIRRGAQVFPQRPTQGTPTASSVQSEAAKEGPDLTQRLPVSAEDLNIPGRNRQTEGMKYGSEIVLQSLLEQEAAHRAQQFMKTGESPNHETNP